MNTFSIIDAYKVGWSKFKNNWKYVIISGLIISLVTSGADIYMYIKNWSFQVEQGPIYALANFVLSLVGVFLGYNLIKGILRASDNHPVSIKNLFEKTSHTLRDCWRYILIQLITGAMSFVFVLPIAIHLADSDNFYAPDLASYLLVAFAIIGGLYVYTLFGFSILSMIDKQKGVIASLKHSYKICHPHAFKLAAFYVISVIAMAVGFALLFIPGIILAGVFCFATVAVYRKISDN